MKATNQQSQVNTSINNHNKSTEETMEKKNAAQSSVEVSKLNSKPSKKEEVNNSLVHSKQEESKSSNEEKVTKTTKKPRKVSQSKMDNLAIDYNIYYDKRNSLAKNIHQTKAILKAKQIIVPAKNKDEKDQAILLNPAQLADYRNRLASYQAELQSVNFKLDSLSVKFSTASKTNTAATKAQITRNNIRANRKSKAIKNSDALRTVSDSVADKLISNNDIRMEAVKEAMNDHPQKINAIWYGILKTELVDHKVAGEKVTDLLSAAPSVRSKLAKRVASRLS